MRKFAGKIWSYVENLWTGTDGKPSLKAVMAISFAINLMINISHAIKCSDMGKQTGDLSMILGIEAGLIAALLGLTAYSNIMMSRKSGDQNQ